eukprot:m.231167 g.231167  ORF g.231167 m.231167 type:complete len:1252 (-) comp18866_c1_seq4:135-3890(-)
MADSSQEQQQQRRRRRSSVAGAAASGEPPSFLQLAKHGEKLSRRGEYRRAVNYYLRALQTGTDDAATMGTVHCQLANCYFQIQDYEKAMVHHKKDLSVAKKQGDRSAEAKAYGNIGTLFRVELQHAKAMECFRRQLAIFKELQDPTGQASAFDLLGTTFQELGSMSSTKTRSSSGKVEPRDRKAFDVAMQYYRKHVVSTLSERDKRLRVLDVRARQAESERRPEAALKLHQQRLDLCSEDLTEAKSMVLQASVYGDIGRTQQVLHNYTEATGNYACSLQLAGEGGDVVGQAVVHARLAHLLQFLGDCDAAIKQHLALTTIAEQHDMRVHLAQAHGGLGTAYEALGQYDKAVEAFTKQTELARIVGDPVLESEAFAKLGHAQEMLEFRTLRESDESGRGSVRGRISKIFGAPGSTPGKQQRAPLQHDMWEAGGASASASPIGGDLIEPAAGEVPVGSPSVTRRLRKQAKSLRKSIRFMSMYLQKKVSASPRVGRKTRPQTDAFDAVEMGDLEMVVGASGRQQNGLNESRTDSLAVPQTLETEIPTPRTRKRQETLSKLTGKQQRPVAGRSPLMSVPRRIDVQPSPNTDRRDSATALNDEAEAALQQLTRLETHLDSHLPPAEGTSETDSASTSAGYDPVDFAFDFSAAALPPASSPTAAASSAAAMSPTRTLSFDVPDVSDFSPAQVTLQFTDDTGATEPAELPPHPIEQSPEEQPVPAVPTVLTPAAQPQPAAGECGPRVGLTGAYAWGSDDGFVDDSQEAGGVLAPLDSGKAELPHAADSAQLLLAAPGSFGDDAVVASATTDAAGVTPSDNGEQQAGLSEQPAAIAEQLVGGAVSQDASAASLTDGIVSGAGSPPPIGGADAEPADAEPSEPSVELPPAIVGDTHAGNAVSAAAGLAVVPPPPDTGAADVMDPPSLFGDARSKGTEATEAGPELEPSLSISPTAAAFVPPPPAVGLLGHDSPSSAFAEPLDVDTAVPPPAEFLPLPSDLVDEPDDGRSPGAAVPEAGLGPSSAACEEHVAVDGFWAGAQPPIASPAAPYDTGDAVLPPPDYEQDEQDVEPEPLPEPELEAVDDSSASAGQVLDLAMAADVGLGDAIVAPPTGWTGDEVVGDAVAAEPLGDVAVPMRPKDTPSTTMRPISGMQMAVPRLVALYDYVGQSIAMLEGDVVADAVDVGDGWVQGRILRTGQLGHVPATYLAALTAEEGEEQSAEEEGVETRLEEAAKTGTSDGVEGGTEQHAEPDQPPADTFF